MLQTSKKSSEVNNNTNYEGISSNCLPTFRKTLGLPSSVLTNLSRVKYIILLTFEGEPLGCSKISVRNYHYTLSNNTEKQEFYRPQHGA